MKPPNHSDPKPGFLFVHQAGATDHRGKAERRRISSHVMRDYVAKAKDGHGDRRDRATEKPLRRIIQFSLSDTGCEQLEFRLPCLVAANSFDPFDSLATDHQRNMVSIIKSLFEIVQYDGVVFPWTERYFEVASHIYWDIAMSDVTAYHVFGIMATQLIVQQDKDLYFHKVEAYRSLRQNISNVGQSQDEITKAIATLLSISSLLFLAGRGTTLEECLHHIRAFKQLLTRQINDNMNPTTWFTVLFNPLNFCTVFPFAYPTIPYYAHPACKWQHLIDGSESEKASAHASFACSLLPSAVVSPTITDLFRRMFVLTPLAIQARHYEAIMGLYLDLKYDFCAYIAEAYWSLPSPPASMAAYHIPNASAPFMPSLPEVAFFQQVHESSVNVLFGGLEGNVVKATYMLLIALELGLWTLCANRTRIKSNAGTGRFIDSIAEFASEPECQTLFSNHGEALLWIVTAGIAYSRYSLREPVVDLRLSVLARSLLQRCGVRDINQLMDVMDQFSGHGIWSRDALVLVFQDVECVEASIKSD